MATDIKKALEATQSELKTAREKNLVLEKECVVYKSQLEVAIIVALLMIPCIVVALLTIPCVIVVFLI